MRITIMGIGALGCLFGAKLSAVADVSLIGHWPDQILTIQGHGLWLEHPGGERSNHQLDISSEPDAIGKSDAILVAVKSGQTEKIAQVLKSRIAGHSLVVTLQNGLNNYACLTKHIGLKQVTLGVTSEGATVLAPGYVRHAGRGKTYLGRRQTLGHNQLKHLETMASHFNSAGFDTTIVDNTEGLLWGKLAVNAAINPLTALLRMPNGYLLTDMRLVDLMSQAATEVASVAAAKGIELPFTNAVEQALSVARATAANQSSMLQDVLRGVPTEIDAICGAIVAAGRDTNVPTPLNAQLFALMKRIEGGRKTPPNAGDVEQLLSCLADCETGNQNAYPTNN